MSHMRMDIGMCMYHVDVHVHACVCAVAAGHFLSYLTSLCLLTLCIYACILHLTDVVHASYACILHLADAVHAIYAYIVHLADAAPQFRGADAMRHRAGLAHV
jgi:hypothetical protein